MKAVLSRRIVVLFVVLLSFSSLTILNVKAQVMSFEEAIDALERQEFDIWQMGGFTSTGTASEAHIYFSEEEQVSGYLMWISANGTASQIEYPTFEIINEIKVYRGTEVYNDPKGYYIWVLWDVDGWIFSLNANNGTIVDTLPPRNGPTSSPTPQPIQSPSNFEIAIIVITIVFGFGLIINFLKKRRS